MTEDGTTTTYTYDERGNVLTETTGTTVNTYTYDHCNNRISHTLTVGGAVISAESCTYDQRGRLTSVSSAQGKTTYGYDGNNARISETTTTADETSQIVSTTYSYAAPGVLTSIQSVNGNGAILANTVYSYYMDGNIHTETDHLAGTAATYTYDKAGRLKTEVSSAGSYSYTYDFSGNRATMTENGTTTTYTYDENNRLLRESKPGSIITYTYDANGNLLTGDGATYTYDARNRQVGYVKGSDFATYTYYPSGLRKTKTTALAISNYIWDGSNMICEYASSATSGKVYVYGHTLISQGNSWYYLYNAHGDVVKYTNATGAVLKSYDYDAFGEEADPSTTDTNPFRYAGQYFDDETGTYYLRARYYNPGNGRFTQQDAWGYGDPSDPLSLNLYVYCYGNPVKYYDPSGNIPVETVADVLGAVGSLADLIKDPSLSNALFLLWDVGSIVLPYVPGSYVAKAVKTTAKIINKIDDAKDWIKTLRTVDNIADLAQDFMKAHDRVLGSYKDLKKLVKKLGVKGLEVHHLIEKRFAGLLNVKENAILSVALDEDTHQKITNAFRQVIGYVGDKNPKITTNVDIQELWLAIVKVYSGELDGPDLREYLGPLKEWFIKNVPNVGDITDWGGY